MNRLQATLIILALTFPIPYTIAEPLKLESKLLSIADGSIVGIGAQEFGVSFQLRVDLRVMQTGKKSPVQKECMRMFAYKNGHYTIGELVRIESEATQDSDKQALAKTLTQAKQHFAQVVVPSLRLSAGKKQLSAILIEESCSKRGLTPGQSFLFNWGTAPEGREMETFFRSINSFKEFNLFLTHLGDFLEDFLYSCPKARAQYIEATKKSGR